MQASYTELLGSFASVVVVISMSVKSLFWLRFLNLLGASCFIVYGLLINAFPVYGLNIAIVCIHSFHLLKLKKNDANTL